MKLFNIKKELGRGSFGKVYLGEKLHCRQEVVLKEIPTELMGDDLAKAQNEVNILRSLSHPNVISYLYNYVENRLFYIVMEYAEHGNLQQLIAERKATNNYFDAQTVMNFFCQIVFGLDHIHQKGILHRDLKCENVFVTGIAADVLKIGDFGIAKLLKQNYFANTMVGTCNYVAPEICDGKPYNKKTDIWALGCILYELCQLDKMFDGTISSVVLSIVQGKRKSVDTKKYGKQMQEILNLLLCNDPDRRPDTTVIMSLSDVFPSLYSIPVNLGCIF